MMQTFVEQLISTPEGMRLFRQEQLILDVTERISAIMEEQKITKAELASRLGTSRSFITQLLDGSANMTLRTIADVMSALGRCLCVSTGDLATACSEVGKVSPPAPLSSDERVVETGALKVSRTRALRVVHCESLYDGTSCFDERPSTSLRLPA